MPRLKCLLDQVMNGRHFNRGMRVHSHMLAAVERLLIKVFVERNCIDITAFPEIINLAKELNASTFGKMNSSTGVNVIITFIGFGSQEGWITCRQLLPHPSSTEAGASTTRSTRSPIDTAACRQEANDSAADRNMSPAAACRQLAHRSTTKAAASQASPLASAAACDMSDSEYVPTDAMNWTSTLV